MPWVFCGVSKGNMKRHQLTTNCVRSTSTFKMVNLCSGLAPALNR